MRAFQGENFRRENNPQILMMIIFQLRQINFSLVSISLQFLTRPRFWHKLID